MTEKFAMIFAAGKGTRLAPLTEQTPKALITLNDKPILWYIVNKLKNAGFTNIVINVHHHAKQIIDYIDYEFAQAGLSISISVEKDFLADTGGGLKLARNYFAHAQHILLHNVDILSTLDMNLLWQYHLNNQSLATLAVSKRESTRQLFFDEKKHLCGWFNTQTQQTIGDLKKARYNFAFSGIHVVSAEIFNLMPEEDIFSMTHLYLKLCHQYPITYFEHDPYQCMDIGTPEQLQKAKDFMKKLR